MNSADQVKAIVLLIGGGIVLIFLALRRRQTVRKIQDTARSKIASAPQGYIELQGFAWPHDDATKLASGHEAVYYNLQLQRQESRGTGKNRRKVWVTVFSHSVCHPFYIVDSTGLALVDLAMNSANPEDLKRVQFNLDSAKTTNWRSLSQKEKEIIFSMTAGTVSGFPPSDFLWGLFSAPYRVVENEIYVGSPLYLHGNFATDTQDAPPVRPRGLADFFRKVFQGPTGSLKDQRALFDKSRDGKISFEEAQKGYATIGTWARTTKAGSDDQDFIIYGKMNSSFEHPLMIADAHEEHLIERMSMTTYLCLVPGILLLSVGLMVLAMALGVDFNFRK